MVEFSRFCGQCGRELGEVAEPVERDAWIGRTVDRRYRVVSLLGSGGMGLVYKVEHLHLGKNAAMKVLRPGSAEDSEAVRRFRIEARAVSRLNHPNIVQTFDFGLWEGALYLVMEYINGQDLAALVMRQGPLPYHRALPLFVQICSALIEAHDLGVIHRDLKPENLMVVRRRDDSEHAKVLDFGLAKLREHAGSPEMATGDHVVGSPDYMSPEQIRAEPLDERADIYGLGASLYRVLTGTAPFSASSAVAVLTKHILDPLEPLRARRPDLDIPVAVGRVVEKAMAKAREGRQMNVAQLQRELEGALAESTGGRGRERQPVWRPAALASDGKGEPPLGAAPATHVTAPIATAIAATDFDEPSAEDPEAQSEDGGRLRRSEFDAFERSLRRRRWLWLGALPLTLLAVAGLWAMERNRDQVTTAEVEPNNTPAAATNLRSDSPMGGHIGERETSGQPDLDYFHVPAGTGARSISARLEGIAGVDLVLEMFDSAGDRIAKSDGRGIGGDEWIQPTTTGPGDAYLLVRQLWIQGEPLLEKVANGYRLTVHWGAPAAGWEVEPNDRPEQALTTRLGVAVKGYLGTATDEDWFEYRAERTGEVVTRLDATGGVLADVLLESPPGDPQAREGREKREGRESSVAPPQAGAGAPEGQAGAGANDDGLAAAPTEKRRDRSGLDEQGERPAERKERGNPRSKRPPERNAGALRVSVAAGQTIRFAVIRKPTQNLDPKAPQNTVGLDSAYEITVERAP